MTIVHRLGLAVYLGAALAACTTGELDAPDGGEPASSDWSPPPDGTRVQMRVHSQRTGNTHEVTAIARHGHAIWEGDIDLGPIPDPELRALEIMDIDARWPGGIVHYVIDNGFSSENKVTIREAMDQWQDRVPMIQFIPGAVSGEPTLEISTSDDGNSTSTEGVGALGWTGIDLQTTTFDIRVPAHELGHALGFGHEATRADRDSFVTYSPEFTQGDDQDQFDINTDDTEVFAYDINSIMQYPSTNFCVAASPGDTFLFDNCLGFPLVPIGISPVTSVTSQLIGRNENPSGMDTLAISWMYEHSLSARTVNERFGNSFAVGDLDGDGFLDVVVGAPGEHVEGSVQTGAVFIYRGAPGGRLVLWREIREADLAPVIAGGTSVMADGDEFGTALKIADFDGDGNMDLAIGSPQSATTAGGPRGGVVYVMFGTGNQPAFTANPTAFGPPTDAGIGPDIGTLVTISQATSGQAIDPNARFGASLAVANYGFWDDLLIGAPNATVNGASSGEVFTFMFPLGSRTPSFATGLSEPASALPAAGDQFGSAMAAADYDDDGSDDVAIGAPGNGSGKVFVYSALAGNFAAAQTLPWTGSTGDRFGADLAVGDYDGTVYSATNDRRKELAIGAPGVGSNSGRISIMSPKKTNTGLVWTQLQLLGQPNGANTAGDGLGSHLAAGDVNSDGFTDLVAGIPFKDTVGNNAGSALVYFAATTGAGLTSVEIAAPAAGGSPGDLFGSAVHLFGSDTLIIGMPGDDGNEGSFVQWTLGSGVATWRDESTVFPLQ